MDTFDAFVVLYKKEYTSFIHTTFPSLLKYSSLRTCFVLGLDFEFPLENEQLCPVPSNMLWQYIDESMMDSQVLPQLARFYAFRILGKKCLDNLLILNSDVLFKERMQFFSVDTLDNCWTQSIINTSSVKNIQWQEHLLRILPGCNISLPGIQGIIYYQPWQRHIIQDLMLRVENRFGTSFWKAYISNIKCASYEIGACEYFIVVERGRCLIMHQEAIAYGAHERGCHVAKQRQRQKKLGPARATQACATVIDLWAAFTASAGLGRFIGPFFINYSIVYIMFQL